MTDHEQPAAGVALKPCPFCGPETTLKVSNWGSWYVRCEDCQVQQFASTKERAIEEWNTRAPTDAGGAVSEAVRRLRLVTDGNQVEAVYRKEGFVYPETTFRGDLRAVLAALTPAPQAEGEFDSLEPWEHDDQRELSLLYRHRFDDTPQFNRGQMRTAIRHGRRLSAPQPLQQGGEVTREQVARIIAAEIARQDFCPDVSPDTVRFDQGLEWDYVDQGTVDFGVVSDAILALFASPDLGDLAGLVETLTSYAESEINPDDSLPMKLRVGPIMFRNACAEAARALRSLAADRDKAVGLLRRWLPQGGRYDAAVDTRAFLSSQTEES